MPYQIGFDIGGTFTDVVFLNRDTGELLLRKALTTPKDPSQSALNIIRKAITDVGLVDLSQEIESIIHGTTLVVNAIVERRGSRTGLITTKGFRDIIEARKEKRYDLYDIFIELPQPLVPRYLRRGVTERSDERGTILQPLDLEETDKILKDFIKEKVESIAVCFLHSYRNPRHEFFVRDLICEKAPHITVSLSSEVVPEIREYERFSTTVCNAYTQPILAGYLSKIEGVLHDMGVQRDLTVMLSHGGIASSETARRFPVRVMESGPAGGVMAASFYGKLKGWKRIVSFDMGGTTAKICLVEDGKPMMTNDFEVAKIHRFKKGSGLAVKISTVDMIEIGAGGGSIATIDRLGLMKVGPASAGANPGPACYGLGGNDPTVTDADLILGYLNEKYFLGGQMELVHERAKEAIEEKLGSPLGLNLAEVAWGIRRVVDENMTNAARMYAFEKGKDMKAYTLIAFGGAGPVHACALARKLGITRVFVPFGAGVASAVGFLCTPLSIDFVRSYVTPLNQIDLEVLNRLLKEMDEEGFSILGKAGIPKKDIEIHRKAEMRYLGQSHEISVPIPAGTLSQEDLKVIHSTFEKEYEQIFSRTNPGYHIEAINWRVLARGPELGLHLKSFDSRDGNGSDVIGKGRRSVYFEEFNGYDQVLVFDRCRLLPGSVLKGPAIIEDVESTTVIGPGWTTEVDEFLNLTIERED